MRLSRPVLRPRHMVTSALVLAALAGSVSVATGAAASDPILTPIGPFDLTIKRIEVYEHSSRVRVVVHDSGVRGTITRLDCSGTVNKFGGSGGDGLQLTTRVNVSVRASGSIPIAGYSDAIITAPIRDMPGLVLSPLIITCKVSGVDAFGRAEVNTGNNSLKATLSVPTP